jgi:hypothetical protein
MGTGGTSMTDQNRKINKMALAGFILVLLSVTPLVFFRYFVGEWFTWAFLFSLVVLSPVGLILSVIGLVHSIKNKEKGKFFAITAIVINFLETAFIIILFLGALFVGMSKI